MNGGAGGAAGSDRVRQKKHRAVRSWGSLLRILLEGTLLERTLCPHPERCVPLLDAAASSTRAPLPWHVWALVTVRCSRGLEPQAQMPVHSQSPTAELQLLL